MKTLFKEKGSRFTSLVCLIALSVMMVVFFLTFQDSMLTVAGRVFSVVWLFVAVLAFVFHSRRLRTKRRYHPYGLVVEETGYSRKKYGRKYLRG